jgi:predicted Zn-dependent protease
MWWCSTCAAESGGWSRRQLLVALGQACLAAGLTPRRAGAFSVYDESGDVKIGREADPEILKQLGYYDGPEIQNYVAQIGQRVASTSDTRFSFQFKVVDQPNINAMALPGGFVYVTRGMLGELNDEAQLATILGHEMTHVNSRHGAKLMTKAMGAQIATLLGLGAAAATGGGSAMAGVALISGHLANYWLLGYGREYEQEADEVGLRYAHTAGYDPRRMVVFLRALRRKEMLGGQTMYHGFEATHPDTSIRIAKADTMANLLVSEGGALLVKTDEYRDHIDGLTYGEAKEQRVLRVYTVKSGDTLASIARDRMGDEGRRYELAGVNGLRDDAAPAPGSRLKLVMRRSDTNKSLDLQIKKE